MSEMRQRRGEPASKDEEIARLKAELEALKKGSDGKDTSPTANGPEDEEAERRKLAEDIADALQKSKPTAAKGLSDDAKFWKDALAADPFNMELIYRLGLTYAKDLQWERVCNVLLRGWKRVEELSDPSMRYEFLASLAQASQKMKKFKQALAVLGDIEEPEEEELRAHYQLLRCQVFCENGDAQRGLKALSQALEGKSFEHAVAVWANCLGSLRRAGAYDLSRSTVAALASSEEELAKLTAMEKLVDLREEIHHGGEMQLPWDGRKRCLLVGVVLTAGLAVLYLLHLAEAESLTKLAVPNPSSSSKR